MSGNNIPTLYTYLHCHTDASDGLKPLEAFVNDAHKKGVKTLAITDHGTLANAVAFVFACKRVGIKPIIGLEGYIVVDNKVGHITVLANGNTGFKSLVALNNVAQKSNYTKPVFTVDELIKHNEGLVLLSGCPSSPLNKMSFAEAKSLQSRLLMAFGNNFYQEIMLSEHLMEQSFERPLELSRHFGTKLILTTDVHFPNEEDAPIHMAMNKIRTGYTFDNKRLYFVEAQKLVSFRPENEDEIIQGITNANELGETLESPEVSAEASLPHIENESQKLLDKIIKAIKDRHLGHVYIRRAREEFATIKELGYSAYFLIVADIVEYAKSINVRVGPGRGSAAGSLLLYLLGVTDVDPIKYNLSFERFLNKHRKGMPDVDIDFDSLRRQEVLDYANRKYGAVPIATYSTWSHKSLVHDLATFFRLPRELEQKAADEGPEGESFAELCRQSPDFKRYYDALLGQIRHRGKHAGGIVITDKDFPLERTKDGVLVAAWAEGNQDLSKAGIVKFDLLGLSALAILDALERKFSKRAEDLKENDEVFQIFAEGDLTGIFQFSGSDGIKSLTMRIKPTCFDDLVAINALYRPGALDVGSADAYPEWKNNPRKVHPAIKDIVKDTYGAIIYQEQVMAIFARITGGTLAQADLARRVIVKSKVGDPEWEASFKETKELFISSAKRLHNMSEEDALAIWDEIAAHARYSFNRAHAVSYAKIAAEMAWWKYHHKADFYAALLNVDNDITYIISAMLSGIEVEPPHVNVSTDEYVAKDGKLFMPLSSIKFLGMGASTIVEARTTPFRSIKDFMERVPRKFVRSNAREGLWYLSAFSGLEGSYEDLQIKKPESKMSRRQAEQVYLGMPLPTSNEISFIKRHSDDNTVVGIVKSSKQKTSNYGLYTVYYLLPSGVFWIRENEPSLKEGSLIIANVSKETGKCLNVRTILL